MKWLDLSQGKYKPRRLLHWFDQIVNLPQPYRLEPFTKKLFLLAFYKGAIKLVRGRFIF